ncbi:hypothetical protein FKW77_009095 [Venturia effusa]|uniref:Allergen n=1 Tax=Venturia effusa TaxID=50376 RepID=A0A517LG55_9PEZI|nr:hypothetical protein FKW77_009095 [Venturia effusa]
MEKAKAAVSDFMSKSGHHDTTVHEKVAPAVTHNTTTPQRHEEIQTAIDKEVHQDHYHTSVQPVQDREVLPEQHHHNLKAVEHRELHHGNQEDVSRKLEIEAAKFKNEHVRAPERRTEGVAPSVAGEHVHHHVHETIQPIVQKETIEPHVVHTTVPIHEVHHNAAQHHSTSALPTVSMQDFKKQGGVLGGRGEKYDGFEGEPRAIGKALGGHDHAHTGPTAPGVAGSNVPGTHGAAGAGIGGAGIGATGSATKKPSLLDKLNPKKDADGDGKKGFMD